MLTFCEKGIGFFERIKNEEGVIQFLCGFDAESAFREEEDVATFRFILEMCEKAVKNSGLGEDAKVAIFSVLSRYRNSDGSHESAAP